MTTTAFRVWTASGLAALGVGFLVVSPLLNDEEPAVDFPSAEVTALPPTPGPEPESLQVEPGPEPESLQVEPGPEPESLQVEPGPEPESLPVRPSLSQPAPTLEEMERRMDLLLDRLTDEAAARVLESLAVEVLSAASPPPNRVTVRTSPPIVRGGAPSKREMRKAKRATKRASRLLDRKRRMPGAKGNRF